MPEFRIGTAADIIGVSADTLRRWADAGRIVTTRTEGGQRNIEGSELARFATLLAESGEAEAHSAVASSARNRFTGIVTRVIRDTVMAQVEIQSGPHRIVSLISREAADELELEPGVLATASAKATTVTIERSPR